MFVALRPVRETIDGKLVTHRPGAELVNFRKWPALARVVYLEGDVVAEVPDCVLPAAVSLSAEQEHAPAPEDPAADVALGGDFQCPLCPERSYDTERGLRSHLGRAHKGVF